MTDSDWEALTGRVITAAFWMGVATTLFVVLMVAVAHWFWVTFFASRVFYR